MSRTIYTSLFICLISIISGFFLRVEGWEIIGNVLFGIALVSFVVLIFAVGKKTFTKEE